MLIKFNDLKFGCLLQLTVIGSLASLFNLTHIYAKSNKTPNIDNICWIFKHHPNWQSSAYKASRQWKVPVSTLMATIYQESHFKYAAKAKTSSAYGFAQAVDSIWAEYKQSRGAPHADRRNFSSSIDFIGWYFHKVMKTHKIKASNTEQLYLYYQLGMYHHHVPSYSKKIADKVASRATVYKKQLKKC